MEPIIAQYVYDVSTLHRGRLKLCHFISLSALCTNCAGFKALLDVRRIFTSLWEAMQSIAIGVSVCLYVCPLKSYMSELHENLCDRGSTTFYSSGFVDDIMFHVMEPLRQNQRRRYVWLNSPDGETSRR